MGRNCDFDAGHGQECDFHFLVLVLEKAVETYQNHIRITSKPLRNRIKTVPKPYQNHISTMKTEGKLTKSLSRGCFCFFVSSQPTETLKKDVPFPKQNQNQNIRTISKPFQDGFKTVSKPCQIISKPYSVSFFPSQPIGNLEKAAPFPNHTKTTSKIIVGLRTLAMPQGWWLLPRMSTACFVVIL
jgi:hypothetical protein